MTAPQDVLTSKLASFVRARVLRLVLAAGAAAASLTFLLTTKSGPPQRNVPTSPQPAAPATSDEWGEYHDPALEPEFVDFFTDAGRSTYWLGSHQISGLGPDITPGTKIEIWATWDPPVVDAPQVQKLISDAVVEKVIPASSPDLPIELGISLRDRDVSDMMFGQRYGALAAVVIGPLTRADFLSD